MIYPTIVLQMHGLRRLMQGDAKHPKAPLGNNFRPAQPLHHRPVRTNIDFNVKHRADVSKLSKIKLFSIDFL